MPDFVLAALFASPLFALTNMTRLKRAARQVTATNELPSITARFADFSQEGCAEGVGFPVIVIRASSIGDFPIGSQKARKVADCRLALISKIIVLYLKLPSRHLAIEDQ